MDKLSSNKLRKEFTQQLNVLRDKILTKCTPKTLNGVPLNSRMFCSMIEKYIDAINNGGVPTISTAWEYVLESECINAYNEAIEIYNEGIKTDFGNDEPKTFNDLFESLKHIRQSAIDTFNIKALIYDKAAN